MGGASLADGRHVMSIRDRLSRMYDRVANSAPVVDRRLADIDAETRAIFRAVSDFTMTSPERIAAVCDAVRYVTHAKIAGAYVECGVWRGGSSMAAARGLMEAGDRTRDLYLFDTFEGMSEPSR